MMQLQRLARLRAVDGEVEEPQLRRGNGSAEGRQVEDEPVAELRPSGGAVKAGEVIVVCRLVVIGGVVPAGVRGGERHRTARFWRVQCQQQCRARREETFYDHKVRLRSCGEFTVGECGEQTSSLMEVHRSATLLSRRHEEGGKPRAARRAGLGLRSPRDRFHQFLPSERHSFNTHHGPARSCSLVAFTPYRGNHRARLR